MSAARSAVLCAFLLVSCAPSPNVRRVVGPDGSRMLFVSCGGDEGACYELAGRSCPSGYDLYPTMSRSADHVLLRCRPPGHYWAARGASHWAAAPTPLNPWTGPAAGAPEAPWPNASAATAPENPWPAASGNAGPVPAPSSSTRPRPGEMDLGY